MEKIYKEIESFFMNDPANFGYVFMAAGIFLLVAAIQNWEWMMKSNPNTYNLEKIDGWTNFFGSKVGRIMHGVAGVVIFLCGVVWLVAFSLKK